MEKAREWELAEAREQGKASAWCEAETKALEAHGYQRPKRLAKSSGHV